MSRLRYKAFISYSHQDQKWGAWLQRALERYRIPRRLVGTHGDFGAIPRRLVPVFRDREDLSSASDLSAQIKQSLEASETLIVICSPGAARSRWVSEEVAHFQALGRSERIFALIVDGDPQATDPAQQCFPAALTTDAAGNPREPLAADVRPWADGKLLAKLKIVAGILGIRLDDLRRRDMQQRHRIWMLSMGAALSVAIAMGVLAVMAITAREAAENRREHAESLVGYMVGDLKTKLDEVGRLDILEGMGDRVSEYLQTLDPEEVTDESLTQQARVWRQLGEVSMDQAQLDKALEAFRTSRDIVGELQRRNPEQAQFAYELGNAEFWVGYVLLEQGKFDEAENALSDYLAWAYRLNDLEPGNPEWLMEQSYAHSNLAALINRRGGGNAEGALLHIEQAVEFNRQVMELAPDNPGYISEYGEVLAWLADTQLLTCDLGGALQSRQQNADVAHRQMTSAPGNVTFRSRYAFSLTGYANVALQVGLVTQAGESFTQARDILGQLSVTEPGNVDLRYEYLLNESYSAAVSAERGLLDEAAVRMAAIRQPMLQVLQAESFGNLRRSVGWIAYLLSGSDIAWRAGETAGAAALLDEAIDALARMMVSEHDSGRFLDILVNARFLLWQQRDEELLERPEFGDVPVDDAASGQGCDGLANRVRQAILRGDTRTAQELTGDLLGRGYFEPAFIRVCRQYDLCPGVGEVENP